jgi:hypothetical protein
MGPVGDGDSCGLLPAMLEVKQPEKSDPGRFVSRGINPEDTAFFSGSVSRHAETPATLLLYLTFLW